MSEDQLVLLGVEAVEATTHLEHAQHMGNSAIVARNLTTLPHTAGLDATCSINFYTAVINEAHQFYVLKTFCVTAERHFSICVKI